MAVTAHFAVQSTDTHVSISSRLVAFRHVVDSHSGKNLANIFCGILKELGILTRVRNILNNLLVLMLLLRLEW